MTDDRPFGEILRSVCEENGYDLLPSGVRVALPGGRTQGIEIEPFSARDVEMVRLTSVVGASEAWSNVRFQIALRVNYELSFGAFALRGDELVLTDTLMLEDADAAELAAAIAGLAEIADRYEEQIFETDDH